VISALISGEEGEEGESLGGKGGVGRVINWGRFGSMRILWGGGVVARLVEKNLSSAARGREIVLQREGEGDCFMKKGEGL